MDLSTAVDKKAHVCPPSNATHPSGRWESLFIYSFICKFTNLRQKVEGLESPMDLEEALMSKEPTVILSKVLAQFVVNLKPQTRNLSTDQISSTVASVLSEFLKSSERTIFWNDELRVNVDPFEGAESGIFVADWDFKLKILRQLVELQLCHSPDIKAAIDRAWGVQHNKHKKNLPVIVPPEPSDPMSRENLVLQPIGQDSQRKRYWIADASPRIYVSTNPWKMAATFQTASTTKEEYISVLEGLKATAPSEPKKGQKRTKIEQGHLALIDALEGRLEAIDVELARVAKARKKLEQKRMLYAQAEVRETRTRRSAAKPDYVYNQTFSEDEGDEYTYQGDDEPDEEYDNEDLSVGPRRGRSGVATATGPVGTRRSTRTAALNGNGKRESSTDSAVWRGERRSSRLNGPEMSLDDEPSRKRARTEESTISAQSDSQPSENHGQPSSSIRVKKTGAAALRPTEIALEQVAGKKKSKFWVYAVEPVSESEQPPTSDGDVEMDGLHTSSISNGHSKSTDHSTDNSISARQEEQ